MWLKIKKHQCSCGLKFEIHKAYQLCPSCGKGVLYNTPVKFRCYVKLKGGVPVATMNLSKGDLVEDVVVFGFREHQRAVRDLKYEPNIGFLTSGFPALYERDDIPNVSIKYKGSRAQVIALVNIAKNERIKIAPIRDKPQ